MITSMTRAFLASRPPDGFRRDWEPSSFSLPLSPQFLRWSDSPSLFSFLSSRLNKVYIAGASSHFLLRSPGWDSLVIFWWWCLIVCWFRFIWLLILLLEVSWGSWLTLFHCAAITLKLWFAILIKMIKMIKMIITTISGTKKWTTTLLQASLS